MVIIKETNTRSPRSLIAIFFFYQNIVWGRWSFAQCSSCVFVNRVDIQNINSFSFSFIKDI